MSAFLCSMLLVFLTLVKGRMMGAVGDGTVGLASLSSLIGAAEGGFGSPVRKRMSSSLAAALAVWEAWMGTEPALLSSSKARNTRDSRLRSNGHLSILRR